MRRHRARENKPQKGFQDAIELTRSLEKLRTSSEKNVLKEASNQTSLSFPVPGEIPSVIVHDSYFWTYYKHLTVKESYFNWPDIYREFIKT